MRYQVPQFVDIEDKIIGPFTLKQFLIYLSAVFALVPVYLIFNLTFFLIIAFPVGGLAALFAHYRLHGKTLFQVIGHAFLFFSRGHVFIWQRGKGSKPLRLKGQEYAHAQLGRPVKLRTLAERSRALETAGNIVSEDTADVLDPEAASAPTPAAAV